VTSGEKEFLVEKKKIEKDEENGRNSDFLSVQFEHYKFGQVAALSNLFSVTDGEEIS
jgi:hypothetical protein